MDYTKLKQRLAKGPTEATWEASLGNGQTIRTPGLGHHGDCKAVCEQSLAAIEQLEAHNAALKEQVAQLAADRDTYKQGMAKVIIERDALQSKSAALVDALERIAKEHQAPHYWWEIIAREALAAFKGEKK